MRGVIIRAVSASTKEAIPFIISYFATTRQDPQIVVLHI